MSRRRYFSGAGNLGNNAKLVRCRYCGNIVSGRRRTFCSDQCVHEYKIRSNYNYAREQVYLRDHSICAQCGLNTDLVKAEYEVKAKKLAESEGRPHRWKIVFDRMASEDGWPPHHRTWWEADHIVAIAEGGGMGGIETYQTLCYKCHKNKTVDMRHRLKGTGNKFIERNKDGSPGVFWERKDP